MYGIASVSAPLMGGAFTTRLTWRYCFYINLPFGAITIAVVWAFFTPTEHKPSSLTWKEKLDRIDVLGTALLLPGITCLLLALQWGGSAYAWSSSQVIVLLVLTTATLMAFIGVQIWKQELATVPPRIFVQRSVFCSAWYVFAAGGAMNVLEYFVGIRHVS